MIDDIKRWLRDNEEFSDSSGVSVSLGGLRWCVAEIERLRLSESASQAAATYALEACARMSAECNELRTLLAQRCDECGHFQCDAETQWGRCPGGPSWVAHGRALLRVHADGGAGCDNCAPRARDVQEPGA